MFAIALATVGFDVAAAEDQDEPAKSERGENDGYAMELWTGLMSPFCPGRLLIDCPSSQADEMRDRIAAEEAAGRSRDEVVADLYAEYGDIIWQAPRAEGFGLAAYVIPLVAGVLGMGMVGVFLHRQRRAKRPAESPQGPPAPAAPAALDPETERRIDAEMNEYGA